MEQHAVPRQITTFEFKLIGFMTVRQFIFLLIFLPSAYVVFVVFPIPVLNFLLGAGVAIVGIALAFLKISDKSIDQWGANLWLRLNSPTQYFYYKHNDPLYFINDLLFIHDPHIVLTHVISKDKLAEYLTITKQIQSSSQRKKQINNMLYDPNHKVIDDAYDKMYGMEKKEPIIVEKKTDIKKENPKKEPLGQAHPPLRIIEYSKEELLSPTVSSSKEITVSQDAMPFISGVVKNSHNTPIPNMLVYIKETNGNPVRLLKTNISGIFATFTPFTYGEYILEIKDVKQSYFFDSKTIKVGEKQDKPLLIYAHEVL